MNKEKWEKETKKVIEDFIFTWKSVDSLYVFISNLHYIKESYVETFYNIVNDTDKIYILDYLADMKNIEDLKHFMAFDKAPMFRNTKVFDDTSKAVNQLVNNTNMHVVIDSHILKALKLWLFDVYFLGIDYYLNEYNNFDGELDDIKKQVDLYNSNLFKSVELAEVISRNISDKLKDYVYKLQRRAEELQDDILEIKSYGVSRDDYVSLQVDEDVLEVISYEIDLSNIIEEEEPDDFYF